MVTVVLTMRETFTMPQVDRGSLLCFYPETDLMTMMVADKANDKQMFKCAHT